MIEPVRIYLIRHTEAAAPWTEDMDPGLSDAGREQAEAMAAAMELHGPLPIICSPLKRARETARPLERRWSSLAGIEAAMAEVPSVAIEPDDRRAFLDRLMTGRWSGQDAGLRAWRERVVETLLHQTESVAVVSHFVAINVAVGAATDDERVVCFQPDNGSVTVLEIEDGRLRLVELGHQRSTVVQ